MKRTEIASLLLVAPLTLTLACTTAAPPPTEAPKPTSVAEDVSEPESEAEEKVLVNTLRWTTASEVDNFGFDVYRSLSEDGPFDRITTEPMPGAGTVDEPQSYVFVDDTIDPTKGYYYYIESISMDGVREKFSPVSYVKPKKR